MLNHFHLGNPASLALPVNCKSAQCNWPRHYSLGFCSSCQDVTSTITQSCSTGSLQQCNYTTPQGDLLQANPKAYGGSYSTPVLNTTVSTVLVNHDDTPTDVLLTLAIIRFQDQKLQGIVPPVTDVHQCMMSWCAQAFDPISVRQGDSMTPVPAQTWRLAAPTASPNAAPTRLGDQPPGQWRDTMEDSHTYFTMDYGMMQTIQDTGECVRLGVAHGVKEVQC